MTGTAGLDPSELECVAWSESLRRFVPALGCTLVAEPGKGLEGLEGLDGVGLEGRDRCGGPG
jgi:hypothetical protein